MKECVLIKAIVQRFPHSKGKAIAAVEKQFPGILGHARMIHKTQGHIGLHER